jgi:CO dehydrogenase nickel-insertion accessory protein CooC1
LQRAIRDEKRLEKEIDALISKQFLDIYNKLKKFEGEYVTKNNSFDSYLIDKVINHDDKAILINFKGDKLPVEILDRRSDPRIIIENNSFYIRKRKENELIEANYEIQKTK